MDAHWPVRRHTTRCHRRRGAAQVRPRNAHLRAGRPCNAVELCRRHAPVAAQWAGAGG